MIRTRKSYKSVIATLLTFSMLITCGPSTVIASAATTDTSGITRLTTDNKQGVILHAWDWSFNTVTANLDAIKEAGYTEVQVSPIQVNKDLLGQDTTTDKWWILYQPAGFRIGNKQLGTKEEFTTMCTAAHAKGIKIIVDTIVNHMGNNGDPNQPAAEVDAILKNNPAFWHTDSEGKLNVITDYNNRYQVTHYGVSLPDLNTGNTDLQKIIHDYLQECLDAGADGFRFDTAKHVELPVEPEDTATTKISSNFWPSALGGLKLSDESTSLAGGDDKPFVYAEVLQGGADNIAGYAKYFNVTASKYGNDIRSTVGVGTSGPNLSGNIDKLKSYDVPSGIDNSQIVTWVESHDTYANDSSESTAMTDVQIKNGWAIVASRENSTPLFFNRPAGRKKLQGNIGDAGSDTWKDPDVVAINKFHSAMEGQDESLIKLSDNVLMIERGTSSGASKKGVVIVNLGSTPYALPAGQTINLSDGTYTNCAPEGGTFTVAGGQISGTVPSGITVLYAGGAQEQPVITPKVSIDTEDCSFTDKLNLTLHVTSAASAAYSIDGVPQGSYADGQPITIGESAAFGATIKVVVSATSSDGKTASETYTYIKRDPNAKTIVYFTKPAGWQIPYAYVYNNLKENYNNAAWPGTKMVKIGDNLYKLEIDGFTNGQVIFNDWFYGNHQTNAFPIAPSDNVERKLYDTNGTWNNTTALTEDASVPEDTVTNGTAKVYFQKPSTADWAYDDVNIYFYGKGGPKWPGVPMTKVSDNLYTYTLPAGLEGSNVIFNANGGGIQVPGNGESGLTAPANTSMILVDKVWKEYVEQGTSKVYFRKPADWGEPKVYAYPITGNSGSKVSAEVNTWPGVTMGKVSGTDTLYSYTFSSDSQNMNIIITDGTNKYPSSDGYQLLAGESKIYDNGALRDFTLDDLQEPEKPSTGVQGVTKVYFKNTFGWAKVNVYAYNADPFSEAKGWPGAGAVDEGNGLYSYTLPKGFEAATVIFNNGQGKQTNNLQTKVGSTMEFVSDGTETDGKLNGELVSKSKVYFKNTLGWEKVSVYAFNASPFSELKGWPGVSTVDEGDGLYSYTLPDEYENATVIFNNNNNGKQAPDEQAQAGKTLILDGDTWREFTAADIPSGTTPEQPPEEVGSKVYVKVPSGWSGVPNIYYYNDAYQPTWPGDKMKDEGNGLYSYGIPKKYGDVKIIINDGENKLLDKDGNENHDVKLGSTIIFEDGVWKDYVKPTPDPGTGEVSKTPVVDGRIYTSTTTVKGTAGANADIVLSVENEVTYTTTAGAQVVTKTKVEEKEIGSSKANANGYWSVQIPAQKRDTVIKVTAKEEGKLEASITVTVKKRSSSHSSSTSTGSSNAGGTAANVDSIKDEISKANGASVVINLSSLKPVAEKAIFEALANNPSKTVIITLNNVSWTFNGTDIAANGVTDIDTTVKSTSTNASAINSLTGGKEIINLSFAYNGKLPGKATIKANVDSKYNDKVMYMYSYSAANNRLALVASNVPVKDGAVTFETNKGSDYVLSETPIAGAVTEGWNKIADSNWIYVKDENNVVGWIYDGGNWYLTNGSGIMQKGWSKASNGKWYYLNSAGAMQTGWINDNGTWYYLSSAGDMLADTTINGYKLGANGAWIA